VTSGPTPARGPRSARMAVARAVSGNGTAAGAAGHSSHARASWLRNRGKGAAASSAKTFVEA
jgi:hypothetical protein